MPIHYSDVIMSVLGSHITGVWINCSTLSSGGPDQRIYQSSASLAFVRGIHRIPPTKTQQRGKCFHFMTSSCGRKGTRTNTYMHSVRRQNMNFLCSAKYHWFERWNHLKCVEIVQSTKRFTVIVNWAQLSPQLKVAWMDCGWMNHHVYIHFLRKNFSDMLTRLS